MCNLFLNLPTNSRNFSPQRQKLLRMKSWRNQGTSFSCKSNFFETSRAHILLGPRERLLPLEAHLPRQTVDQILPELSPLCFLRFCFPLKPPSISIKRQVLRRADFSFAVDNKSAFPWQGLKRKTRDGQCCHDKPEVTAVEREEAAFNCVVSFFLPCWMVLHMWSQSKRSHFKLPDHERTVSTHDLTWQVVRELKDGWPYVLPHGCRVLIGTLLIRNGLHGWLMDIQEKKSIEHNQ